MDLNPDLIRGCHRECDLAESLVGLKTSMSILDLFDWEDGIDHRLNSSLLQQRSNFLTYSFS